MSLQDKISSAKPTTFLTDGLSEEEVKQAVDEGRKSVSDTVKLIIEIPKEKLNIIKNKMYCGIYDSELYEAIANGTPLANDSERAEVQAYFAGKAYGWEQGRKALIDDLKAEIESLPTEKTVRYRKAYIFASDFKPKVLEVLDNIGKESEEV